MRKAARALTIALALIWSVQSFASMEDAVMYLRTLPLARAKEAKIVASIDGWGNQAFDVICRTPDLTWCGDNCD